MPTVGGVAGERLRSFLERIERLDEEIVALKEDVKGVFGEAKAAGFDVKVMRGILRLRRMDRWEREEYEALLDIYKASLGMLDGTPLGVAAVRRLNAGQPTGDSASEGSVETEKDNEPAVAQNNGTDQSVRKKTQRKPASRKGKPVEVTPQMIEEARETGRAMARANQPVTANPYPPHDPRRAAFDEAWCQAAGSDGMDIPAAWRRSEKPKPNADAKPDDEGEGEGEGEGGAVAGDEPGAAVPADEDEPAEAEQ